MSDAEPTTFAVPASGDTRQRWRDFALLGGLFVLVLAGLGGLAAATGWQETLDGLQRVTLSEMIALLALSLINYLFRGLRWHIFARRLGLPTSLWQNIRHFLAGFAMSVTPGRVGELVRMRWLRRETGWSFERTAPLVLIDRASDLAAMAAILAVALAFTASGIAGAVPVVALALGAAYVATRPRLMRLTATLGYKATGLGARLFARIRRASLSLDAFQDPLTLTAGMVCGIIGWAAEALAFWLLLQWMGADVGLGMATAIFLFATLAGGLTGLPGGVGGAEAAMVGLLLSIGVPLEIAVPATLIIRVTTLWFAIGIGLLVFPFAERISQRKKYVLEAS
ncbi:MAG: lysylphosphatidylglycerol synthase transmembrane domain-containing protein [Pseudomonadota bacterium]